MPAIIHESEKVKKSMARFAAVLRQRIMKIHIFAGNFRYFIEKLYDKVADVISIFQE